MAALDHWHPVLESRRLGRKPVGIKICGAELVLFRGADDSPAALEDRCPHRAMRLSLGRVEQGRLVCPYHGWSFDESGRGKSPATPALRPCARAFDVIERADLVWVKASGTEAAMPELEFDGFRHVCTLRRRFQAPLELVLDNFADDEHTAAVHGVFGYAPERMSEVTLKVEATEQSVWSHCAGPHKRVPPWLAPLFGVYGGDDFTITWTFHFSPLHCVYDMTWANPETGRLRSFRDRVDVLFVPIDDQQTELVYRQFTTMKLLGPLGFHLLIRPITALLTHYEILLDQRIMANLADKSTALRGMQLGRLDKSLGLVRSRFEKLYKGREAEAEIAKA